VKGFAQEACQWRSRTSPGAATHSSSSRDSDRRQDYRRWKELPAAATSGEKSGVQVEVNLPDTVTVNP
jgi:hypothetical protein